MQLNAYNFAETMHVTLQIWTAQHVNGIIQTIESVMIKRWSGFRLIISDTTDGTLTSTEHPTVETGLVNVSPRHS